MSEGTKYDQDKVRLELIPPELMYAVAQILTFGAKKYDDRNWEKGMAWSRVFGACLRHLWCWWGGKLPTTKNFAFGSTDAETGHSHLWHAACCIGFLVTYESRRVGTDDRPKNEVDPINSTLQGIQHYGLYPYKSGVNYPSDAEKEAKNG